MSISNDHDSKLSSSSHQMLHVFQHQHQPWSGLFSNVAVRVPGLSWVLNKTKAVHFNGFDLILKTSSGRHFGFNFSIFFVNFSILK